MNPGTAEREGVPRKADGLGASRILERRAAPSTEERSGVCCADRPADQAQGGCTRRVFRAGVVFNNPALSTPHVVNELSGTRRVPLVDTRGFYQYSKKKNDTNEGAMARLAYSSTQSCGGVTIMVDPSGVALRAKRSAI